MLTYTSSPPSDQILPPVAYKSTLHTTLYDPPIDEFSVLLTTLNHGEQEKFGGIEGPSILIFTKLDHLASLVISGGVVIEITRVGQVFFIGQGVGVEIRSDSGQVTAYRAFVEAE